MTCDTTPAGKTIAFSHKYFRQDKPEHVQLIQITKEKEVGETTRDRREAYRAALPTTTSPPTALRLPSAPTGLLREEEPRAALDTTAGRVPVSGSPSLVPRSQQPSLANLVAAEHLQNLSGQGADSLLHSLSTEWQRAHQDLPRGSHLQAGVSLTGRPQLDLGGGIRSADNSDLLARMAMRAGEREHFDHMRTSVQDAPRMQSLGSLLHTEGASLASLQQQRREAFLQQRLATAGLGSQADNHSRLLLQQHLATRSLVGGAPAPGSASSSLFHSPTPALLPQPQTNSQILSQRVANNNSSSGASVSALQGGWNLEQLLARRHMGSLRQQGSSGNQDGGALTNDELRYLAELRRRGS